MIENDSNPIWCKHECDRLAKSLRGMIGKRGGRKLLLLPSRPEAVYPDWLEMLTELRRLREQLPTTSLQPVPTMTAQDYREIGNVCIQCGYNPCECALRPTRQPRSVTSMRPATAADSGLPMAQIVPSARQILPARRIQ